MAASFPNAKKTFSQVVNGVTKLVAALFNSGYDEIEAIETFIGATGGGTQAYSESLTNMLLSYRRGCNVEYKGAADLYVRAGEIMITDASGNRRLRRNTSDTTVTWANIDTGAEANATYYVYAVADASATTFTILISTNATTPTGATFYRRIGGFKNVGGDILRSTFLDDLYSTDRFYFAGSQLVYDGNTHTDWTEIDLSPYLPTTGRYLVYLRVLADSTGGEVRFRTKGDSGDVMYGSSYAAGASGGSMPSTGQFYSVVFTDASGVIEEDSQSVVGVNIYLVGFQKIVN